MSYSVFNEVDVKRRYTRTEFRSDLFKIMKKTAF
jgi:hypothetical protein